MLRTLRNHTTTVWALQDHYFFALGPDTLPASFTPIPFRPQHRDVSHVLLEYCLVLVFGHSQMMSHSGLVSAALMGVMVMCKN